MLNLWLKITAHVFLNECAVMMIPILFGNVTVRIILQPAFILHRRPFRETSLLLQVLTRTMVGFPLLARGVRTERSRLRPILQPFSSLLLSFQGRGDLMTLQTAEPSGLPVFLQGERLASGFYLNELLIRFLPESNPHPGLFSAMGKC